MRSLRVALGLCAALALGGCQTVFTGSALVGGYGTTTSAGVNRCVALCREGSMRMAGYVFNGEYSTSCICEVPRDGARSGAPLPAGAAGALVATQVSGRPLWAR
jgi:hypothetical protein